MRRRIPLAALLAALCLLLVLPAEALAGQSRGRAADRNGNKILDDLERKMADKSSGDTVDVIVLFNGESSHQGTLVAERDVGSFEVIYEYQRLSGVAAEMTVGQARALAAKPYTDHVQANSRVEFALNTARAAVGADKAVADFGEDGNNENSATCPEVANYCRDDVVAAVIDTGIHSGHVDLDEGKVLGGINCSSGACTSTSWYDFDGHGTASAAIIAGTGEGNPSHRGFAPGAGLVSVKVGSGTGTTIAALDAGIEWTIANRELYGIDIVNMSLNGTAASDGTESTARLTNQAAAAGILPVSAAGNKGPNHGTISYPSTAKYAVSTGAVADPYDTDGGQPYGFSLFVGSGRGPTLDGRIKPELVAPGMDITTASLSTSGYTQITGTSEAAPMVAGAAALVLDANPTLGISGSPCDPADTSADCLDGVIDSTMQTSLTNTMTSTAIDWGAPGKDVEYGHGLLDAYAAIDLASPQTGTGGPHLPAHTRLSGSVSSGGISDTPLSIARTDDPIAVTLLWDRPAGVTTPDYDLALISPSGTQLVFNAYGGNLRQEVIGYQPTVTGTYKIRVISNSGSGPYTLDVSFPGDAAPQPTPPVAPSLNAVARSASQIDLAWSNVDAETGYRLERSLDGQTWQQIAAPPADVTSHSDTGLNAGVTYYYRVLAENGAGQSAWSNVTSARTLTPPNAPSGLTASAQGSTQIALSWADVTDETAYKVQRSADGTTGWTQVGTTAGNVTSFVDGSLSASTTYWYRVIASNAAGDSAPSATASAKTLADTVAPSVPTNLKATNGKGKITLTWTASTDSGGSGLAGYKVYRSTSSTGTYSLVGTVTTNSFVNTASKGVTYWYYVVAYDKANNHSAPSAKVSGRAT